MVFHDRADAGRRLAKLLEKYSGRRDVIVLGLPRGGVVTAHEVSQALQLPLDIIVPRKIGAPGNPEFAIGAVTEEGGIIVNKEAVVTYGIPRVYIEAEALKERMEGARRLQEYRGGRPRLDLTGETVIIVDDGIATGLTMRAATQSAWNKGATKIIVATPVVAKDTLALLKHDADDVIHVSAPTMFGAVGAFYEKFEQVNDEEVKALLNNANSKSQIRDVGQRTR